jgi:hypothetical protein
LMAQDLAEALSDPFDPGEVRWKAQTSKNGRAMAVAYVDARCVMDRLDDVLGADGWQDAYEVLPAGHQVLCRLSLRLGGEWLTRCDVGGESEQPDEGDRCKAAFSDALKRAAVKWGVGRYLYRLPRQWVAYDEQRRQLAEAPALPDWARPRGLTHSQRQVVEGLAATVGADPVALAKWMGVASLPLIPRSRFVEALHALGAKGRAKGVA